MDFYTSKAVLKDCFSFLLASVVGTIGLTMAMLVLNYIYAVPLYAQFANFDISAILGLGNYLFAMVVPFNLIEGVIFSISFFILWTCLKPILLKYIHDKFGTES